MAGAADSTGAGASWPPYDEVIAEQGSSGCGGGEAGERGTWLSFGKLGLAELKWTSSALSNHADVVLTASIFVLQLMSEPHGYSQWRERLREIGVAVSNGTDWLTSCHGCCVPCHMSV